MCRWKVLDGGEMVEFDAVDVLLADSESYLSAMVAQTGAAEADLLQWLVKVKYAFISL